MAKEQKRLKKQLIMKYLILFAIVFLVALKNIYNIEQQKKEANILQDTSASQLIATDTQIDNNQPETNSDAFLKEASLINVSNISGKGMATISMTDNFFVHQVNLETKDPEQNSFYEAWIYKEKPQKEYFPLGQLYNKDGSYQIGYISEIYRLDYSKIMISEESQDKELEQKPTKVLFEGSFKDIP